MMDMFAKKITKETNFIKTILTSCFEMILIYVIFLILARPDIVETLNNFYKMCEIDGTHWYRVWIMIIPFIVIIGLLSGVLEFLLLYSKNIDKKVTKKK